MSLAPGLRGVLTIIVEGLLEGTLSHTIDYGTYPYLHSLSRNGDGDAVEVLAFLDEKVRLLTKNQYSVVFADRKYFASPTRSGLTFALVPAGEAADSRAAKYFGVGGGSNAVYFDKRASDESIEEADRRAIDYARQQAYREAGKAGAASLLEVMRHHVDSVVRQHSPSLTQEQREDIEVVAKVYPRDGSLTLFFARVNSLDLEQIFAVLAVVGQAEPPSY